MSKSGKNLTKTTKVRES